MATSSQAETDFLSWLSTRGAVVSPSVGLTEFPGMGRGAIALADIEPDTLLFSLPRTLLLTTSTSQLPSLLPADEWSSLSGWSPLILILMYERLRGASGTGSQGWKEYLDLLPAAGTFHSLMFWEEDELKELEGSLVLGKIGREEAETDWKEVLEPFIARHEDVLGPKEGYSLELFHLCGSWILSRSFHVEEGVDGEESDEEEDEEEEETESVGDVAMVPMADLLNAKSGRDNARLFYEPLTLNMLATAFIPAGTQIFNTYADPPNSDLLRRYGHVDDQNAADLVELGLETVVDVVGAGMGMDEAAREERAEWLLEVGGEDTFSLDGTYELPEELISAIRAFLASPAELEKAQQKEAPPKPKLDAQVAEWAKKLIVFRESQYPTSIETDEGLLATELPPRRRMAIIVRLGEKKILRAVREKLEVDWPAGGLSKEKGVDAKKRGREDGGEGRKKVKVAK